jgi:eukaryotic-like serine/threonine-protein kinase
VSAAEGPKFKLLVELGRGGMATVYLAVVRGPAGFNKLVVIKCLRPSLAAEPEFLEMFLAEARLAARINHPNVVQTNEVGFDDGFYYIAMEYIEGPTLEAMVRKAGPGFPLGLHLHIIIQVLAGLHHAHELKDFDGHPVNVVHRDVSPHNIMISYDGNVKLLDFGIAKAADSSGNTRTGILKGKCAYMAAEQFGGHNVDRRADIFSAGICLWQAITGARLWKGLSDAEIFSRLSRGEIPSPKTVNPSLPDELVAICMRALALRPEDRFSSAASFAAALEQFVANNPRYQATPRQLATFVAETFAAERTQMRENTDAQLRLAASTGGNLVTFQSDLASGILPASPFAPAQRRSRTPLLLLVGLLILGAAGTVFALRTRSAAVRAQTSGADVGAAQAKVLIRVQPESAKIFFDDAPLSGNPASASLARDGLSHRVRAEAPGFVRKTELVVLDSSNVSVDLELEKEVKDDEVDPFGNKLTALTSKALPAGSRLYLDNVLLPTNPATAKYPRDGKPHQLRAEAVGFVTKTQNITFDSPRVNVAITLDRDPRPATPARATPTPKEPAAAHLQPAAAPHPAAPPPPTPPTPAKPGAQKPLDRDDPWK